MGTPARRSGPHVARVDDNDDTYWRADAALIAAAPDLLAACEKALGVMAQEHRFPPPFAVQREVVVTFDQSDVALLRAAIAKARGET